MWLLSTLSFTIAKKFKNGFEINFEMKGMDFMVFICIGVIGVLGMVPTVVLGVVAGFLKESEILSCVKYKRNTP